MNVEQMTWVLKLCHRKMVAHFFLRPYVLAKKLLSVDLVCYPKVGLA
jgi:hypothetical protein